MKEFRSVTSEEYRRLEKAGEIRLDLLRGYDPRVKPLDDCEGLTFLGTMKLVGLSSQIAWIFKFRDQDGAAVYGYQDGGSRASIYLLLKAKITDKEVVRRFRADTDADRERLELIERLRNRIRQLDVDIARAINAIKVIGREHVSSAALHNLRTDRKTAVREYKRLTGTPYGA